MTKIQYLPKFGQGISKYTIFATPYFIFIKVKQLEIEIFIQEVWTVSDNYSAELVTALVTGFTLLVTALTALRNSTHPPICNVDFVKVPFFISKTSKYPESHHSRHFLKKSHHQSRHKAVTKAITFFMQPSPFPDDIPMPEPDDLDEEEDHVN